MGETVQIGDCTLYCGDAREILPTLPAVGAVVTDPPYGVRDDEWDAMTPNEFARFSMSWLAEAKRLSDRLVVFCVSDGPMRQLCEMLWPRVRQMVWNKPVGSQYAGASESGFWFAHEVILHCHNGMPPKTRRTATLLRQARERAGLSLGAIDIAIRGKKTRLAYRWEEAACLPTGLQVDRLKSLLSLNGDLDDAIRSDRQSLCDSTSLSDVLSYRTETDAVHPCQKPVALMASLVGGLTEPGDTVLDPYMGSGSTLVAAMLAGRPAIGIEKDPAYFATACRRLEECNGDRGLFAETKQDTNLFAEAV